MSGYKKTGHGYRIIRGVRGEAARSDDIKKLDLYEHGEKASAKRRAKSIQKSSTNAAVETVTTNKTAVTSPLSSVWKPTIHHHVPSTREKQDRVLMLTWRSKVKSSSRAMYTMRMWRTFKCTRGPACDRGICACYHTEAQRRYPAPQRFVSDRQDGSVSTTDRVYYTSEYMVHKCDCGETDPCMCVSGAWHSESERRRPLSLGYSNAVCLNVNPSGMSITGTWYAPDKCPEGDTCHKCHTRNEYDYHPDNYKQTECRREQCFMGYACPAIHRDLDNDRMVLGVVGVTQAPKSGRILQFIDSAMTVHRRMNLDDCVAWGGYGDRPGGGSVSSPKLHHHRQPSTPRLESQRVPSWDDDFPPLASSAAASSLSEWTVCFTTKSCSIKSAASIPSVKSPPSVIQSSQNPLPFRRMHV